MRREIPPVGDGWEMNLREGGQPGRWFRNLGWLWLWIGGQRGVETGQDSRYRRRKGRGGGSGENVGNDLQFGAVFGGPYPERTFGRLGPFGVERGEERGVGTRSKLRWGRVG